MHARLLFLSALILGCFGAPAEYGVGFSFGSKSRAALSGKAEVSAGNGRVTSDASGSAEGDNNSHARGGAYIDADGNVIGVNGGLNSKVGGAVRGGVRGEIQSKDGTINAVAQSTLNSTSDVGLTGFGNIATGDEEIHHIREYKAGEIMATSPAGHGSTIDIGLWISVAQNIIENFWLYFWLVVGCMIVLSSCFLLTCCGMYWKLLAEVQSLKMEKIDREEDKTAASDLTKDNIKMWSAKP